MRLLLLLLLACNQGPPVCDDAGDCAGKCPPPSADQIAATDPDNPGKPLTLDDHAWEIFGAELQALRAGVHPVERQGLGFCAGPSCETFLPPDTKALPPGRWRLRAELAVPNVPDRSFKGRFEHTCALVGVTPEGETRKLDQTERDLDLRWESNARGVIVDPLVNIVSPDPAWHRTCAWELSFENPRGKAIWKGRYEVPREAEVATPAPAGEAPREAEAEAPAGDAP